MASVRAAKVHNCCQIDKIIAQKKAALFQNCSFVYEYQNNYLSTKSV